MKRFLVIAMAGLAVVALGSPASAKGINFAHFTGPGLPSGGVTIRGEHQELFATGVLEEYKGKTPGSIGIEGDLGPAYRASYQFVWAPGWRVHQTVYPYADTGIVTFTPSGQTYGPGSEPMSSGWYYTPDTTLRSFLIHQGFPKAAPRAATEDTAPVQKAGGLPLSGSGGGWPPWGWALVAVTLTAATLLAAIRFRRRALTR